MSFVGVLAERLRNEECLARICRERKVSPGFLAVVIEANLAEIVEDWAEEAERCGEFRCPKCDEFFSGAQAIVASDGAACCPDCGEKLEAEVCARCGSQVDETSAVWRGGEIYCRDCV